MTKRLNDYITACNKYNVRWLLTQDVPLNIYGKSFWVCCCGKVFYARYHDVISRDIRCRCSLIGGPTNPQWEGGKFISNSYYYRIKYRAMNKKIDFDLTLEYIDELFIKQDGKCALSGEILTYNNEYSKCTASLDRIDSNIGYINNNVQWLHKRVNKMKQDMSDQELIKWCKRISNYK